MAGTVAALLDLDSLDDPRKFRADVVTIIFPGAVSQALRQVGVRWGQQMTQQLIRRYFTEGLMKSVTALASKYLFVHVTEKALVSKTVPLIGAGIGAGWNYLELKAVGNRAVRYFQQKGIESPRLEAQLLLAHALDCRKTELYTRWDEVIAEDRSGCVRSTLGREGGRAVEYLEIDGSIPDEPARALERCILDHLDACGAASPTDLG